MGKIRVIYEEAPILIPDQAFLNFIIDSGYASTKTELFVVENVKPTSSKEISDFFKTRDEKRKKEGEDTETNSIVEAYNFFTNQNKTQLELEEQFAEKKLETELPEKVAHPSHYTSGNIEVIDIIADQCGVDGCQQFCIGNALKYICRKGKKTDDPTEDVQKAIWYLQHFLTLEQNKKEEF